MSGVYEVSIVAVRWSHYSGGAYYLEAYDNEDEFWDVVAESGPPEQCYKLQENRLVEWDYTHGFEEMQRDAEIDRRHRERMRITP